MLFGQFTGVTYANLIPFEVKFELLRSGGCYSFSCSVPPTSLTFSIGDEFKVFDDSNGLVSYTGTISEIGGTNETGFQISGFNSTLNDLYFPPGFNIPPLTELSAYKLLKGMIESIVPAASILDLSAPLATLGTTTVMSEMGLGGQSFFDALGEFSLKTDTPLAWGVDQDNKIYIYTVSDPLYSSFHRSLQGSDSYTFNGSGQTKTKAVQFTGTGSQLYPPVHSQSMFETSESRYTNMRHSLLNRFTDTLVSGVYSDARASGETGSGQFSTGGGASIQTYGTEKVYEIDNVGENITLSNALKHFAYQTANGYIIQYDVVGENLVATNPVAYTVTIFFNGVATSVSFVETISIPGKVTKRHFFGIPAGTTFTDIRFEMTAGVGGGGGRGVGIRAIQVFEDDRAYPTAWDMVVPLVSNIVRVDRYGLNDGGLQIGTAFFGAPGGADFSMLRYRQASPVVAQREYKWSLKYKAVVGFPFYNDFYVVVEGYDSAGAFVSSYTSPAIMTNPGTSAWVTTSGTFFVPENVASVVSSLRFTSPGDILISGFTLRDARETNNEAYGDTLSYRRTIGTTGRVQALSSEAATIEEADRYIDSWLKTQETTLAPHIETEIDVIVQPAIIFRKPFRITETNVRYPIESLQIDSAKQRIMWMLNIRPRTLEDFIGRRQKTSSGL